MPTRGVLHLLPYTKGNMCNRCKVIQVRCVKGLPLLLFHDLHMFRLITMPKHGMSNEFYFIVKS